MKVCRVCKLTKPLQDFRLYGGNRKGHRTACRKCELEIRRQYDYPYRKDKAKYYKIKDRYGLSKEEYDTLIKENLSCMSCKEEFTSTPHLDHDQKTGRIRGLLCGNCNKALGLLKDNPVKIVRLLSYLLEPSTTISKESTSKCLEVPSASKEDEDIV